MGVDWERVRFLYRTDEGAIDRVTWRRGANVLAAIVATATAPWLALAPHTDHDLAKTPLWAPMTALAYAYLLLYAFVGLLAAISFVNLSAKRFRALGMSPPLGVASLAPLAAFFAGAAHWLQPRVAEVFPRWGVYPFDLALLAALAWTVYALGFREEA